MKKHKSIIVIIVLLVFILLSHTVPRAKYVGTDFIAKLNIPYSFQDWKGKDVSKELNINVADTNFNFINDALAHNYVNSSGQNLLFIILDAGNFHHPKVCFTGAGYKIKELSDTEFVLPDRTFNSHTLFTERNHESFLSFYWIVIDKNIAHKWIEQKFKQLYFSMLNKKRVGLMVRIDIPTKKDDIDISLNLAKQFVNSLALELPPEQADYIFGEHTR